MLLDNPFQILVVRLARPLTVEQAEQVLMREQAKPVDAGEPQPQEVAQTVR